MMIDAEQAGRDVRVEDLVVKVLGPCTMPTPLALRLGENALTFVGAADKVLLDDSLSARHAARWQGAGEGADPPAFELAGPRDRIFFDPARVRCGIVTCGGLCPGINNVIRGIVLELARGYGVRDVLGFRFGYEGLVARVARPPIALTEAFVEDIHHEGGTVLGSSRGSHDPAEVVDMLQSLGIGILFVIGGDGSMHGAMALVAEIERRGLTIAVVGVPKTIDNDIQYIDRSFGYLTAYSVADEVIRSAHVEAMGARDGIGLVKLMGRQSGFLACQAALANTDVDLVLIPELPAPLEGENGVLAYVEQVLDRNGHAVVVVAEGAAQDRIADQQLAERTDKSGNIRLKDVGVFLRDQITAHFRQAGREVTLKYIDPSYAIRSVPAVPSDSVFCWNMARHAVHAAMAGNTEVLVARWHGRFVHVPMALAIRSRKQVEPDGSLWMSVIEATGQPRRFG
jgi:6-phosphofructokinase 1